jgi:hypothetical protein
MDIQRYFWLGTNEEGKEIVTLTSTNKPPKEFRLIHDPDLEVPDDIYTNFISITKEQVLERQKGLLK